MENRKLERQPFLRFSGFASSRLCQKPAAFHPAFHEQHCIVFGLCRTAGRCRFRAFPGGNRRGRCGCIVGSTMGGSSAIAESYRICVFGKGMEEMSSMQFFKCVSHTAAFNVSHLFNVTGVVQAPAAACASAVQAIGQGRDLIANGVQGHGDVRRRRRTCAGGVRFV